MATIRSEVATGRRINGRDGLILELMNVDQPHPPHSTQPNPSPAKSAETPSPPSSASPDHPPPPDRPASPRSSERPATLPSGQRSPVAPAHNSSTDSPANSAKAGRCSSSPPAPRAAVLPSADKQSSPATPSAAPLRESPPHFACPPESGAHSQTDSETARHRYCRRQLSPSPSPSSYQSGCRQSASSRSPNASVPHGQMPPPAASPLHEFSSAPGATGLREE